MQYIKKLYEMKKMNNIIMLALFGGNRGVRVAGAGIYLERGSGGQIVAYQITGESGKVSFTHLDKGLYTIMLEIPRQTGKLEVREAWQGDMQVGYHREKKLYFFREVTGYFSIRFSGLKYLLNENITPMYEMVHNQRINGITVGKIEVVHNKGAIALELSAYSLKNFNKLVEKYKNDAGMSVIRKSN